MSELPNIIRQRIAEAKNVSPHPDADTITAYMEQCLSATERENVTAHFAVCEPCREVLALSQPQIAAETQTVLRPAPVPAWRRLFSPKFGIAALVASMAIIAVLVFELPHNQNQTQQNQQAQTTVSNQIAPSEPAQLAPAQPVETQASGTQAAETQPSIARTNRSSKEIESRPSRDRVASGNARAAAQQPTRTPVLTAGLLKRDYVNTNFFSNNGSDVVLDQQNNSAPSAPQPQAIKAGRVFDASTGSTVIFSDLPTNANGKPTELFIRPTPSIDHGCKFCSKVAQATIHTLHLRSMTPALRASNLGDSALGGPGMFSSTLQKSQSTQVETAPEKTEGGSLANSDVMSSAALGGSSPKPSKSSAVLWKVVGGKLIKSATPSVWEDAYPAAGIQFSSVSARGNDVWAGGSDAALIHSHDGGLTWKIVKLGDGATGTIIGITADPTTVQVKTSDKQIWLSTDGGITWSLQE